MLKVYNTLSRTKETFEPTNPPFVKMYVCGPTVYDSAHIGHGMSYIVFDMIRRYLEYRGYRVRHVQNFTDVEDKIIQRSQLTGTPWQTLTERYIHEFLAQMDALNVKRAHAYPFASREIAGIIGLIERLIAGEYAYSVDGNVNGLLSLGGEKMSKSIGNFITIEEMLGKNDANTLRLFVLSSRYRSPLTFSEESFAAAERGLQRLYAALDPPADGTLHDAMSDGALWEAAQETVQQFEAAMDDDFGTPSALSALFGLARTINAARAAGAGPGFVEAQATLRELMSVLGFRLTTTTGREQQAAGEATPFIELLITIRDELRRQREWALADKIRNRLDAMGVTLEDTAEGATWRRRSESP